jgi:ACS family pantothenate transporter-like MFS transporter
LTLTIADTFTAWIPLVWFQQVHQPYVTPGNRAAAVIAGFNIIVFTTIAVLARKEKWTQAHEDSDSAETGSKSDVDIKEEEVSHTVIAVNPKATEAHGTQV